MSTPVVFFFAAAAAAATAAATKGRQAFLGRVQEKLDTRQQRKGAGVGGGQMVARTGKSSPFMVVLLRASAFAMSDCVVVLSAWIG